MMRANPAHDKNSKIEALEPDKDKEKLDKKTKLKKERDR